jgi:hypothetical protein
MTAKRDIFRENGHARRAGLVPEDRNAPAASALAAPAAAFQRAVSPALRAGDVLALQRAVGNRATAHLIARHLGSGAPLTTATIQRKVEAGKLNSSVNASRVVSVTPRATGVRLQRMYIDDSNAFDQAVREAPRTRKLTDAVFEAASMLRLRGQGDWSATDMLASLSEAQRALEKWKFDQPEWAERLVAVLQVLDREIGQKLTEVGLLRGGLQQPTGTALAEAKRDELERLAMRTVVANVGDYKGASTAQTRYERASQAGTAGYKAPPPIVTERVLETSREETERNAVGVCTNFAYAAAAVLKNHGVRVEVVSGRSGTTTGHSYVVVGRKEESDLRNPAGWGEDCVLVDCWNAAANWGNLVEKPQVVYPRGHWSEMYPVDSHLFDSSHPDAGTQRVTPTNRPVKHNAATRERAAKEREQAIAEAQKERADKDRLLTEKALEEAKDDAPLDFASMDDAAQYPLQTGVRFTVLSSRLNKVTSVAEVVKDWTPGKPGAGRELAAFCRIPEDWKL